jgi:glyoxylase-like metal-dependent hydrolase (beta-lactamase superfamily II)
MIEEIYNDLYKIELPLQGNPLKSINCYLIKGSERFLLIDTGMNRKECLEEINRDLRQLNVDLNKTDFFITHLHADHIGQVSELATGTSKIYFNKKEAEFVKKGDFWTLAYPAALANGFTEEELTRILNDHPGRRYGLKGKIDFSLCSDGDEIIISEYSLTCIETPGHSPGHHCLYDADKDILFSGDHLLGDITPNISAFGFLNENPLKDYLASLNKTYVLDVALVLPGHRELFNDHKGRIDEIKKHHQMRLNEVLTILEGQEGLTAYEIASRMSWDISNNSWVDFPLVQKWFATAEALAHLIYLEDQGAVIKQMIGKQWHYSLLSGGPVNMKS